MNTDPSVIAKKISYKINDNKLFHDLSFCLNKGKALHICGDNGSGKSTLIRIILGITKQTKGELEISSTKGISYLGHKNAIKNYLSVEDNILLMQLHNHKDLNRYIEILNLKKYLDVLVANLSFGQQKKLALLRIFLNNSDIIILDEPFVGLDNETQKTLSNFLNEQLENNKILIFTSHISCEINSEALNIS
ncbi:MAG: heme ABC exporter ATP-binding protein CcmA [Gammaproteobacteria bacterium TMED225]|nr:MAG: heme ABC exporter ATP-binding protein CcmA [Gammaproteobacteria bacterium TMED225]|tara:strand:+ start:2351 stop:2926 length:576 start_codon:yes stop_codon:yes gene_type:complete